MSSDRTLQSSFAQGYALCTPEGTLLPHSFRSTKAGAIASVFSDAESRGARWAAAEEQGMTIEFVYARVFTPVFFSRVSLCRVENLEIDQ